MILRKAFRLSATRLSACFLSLVILLPFAGCNGTPDAPPADLSGPESGFSLPASETGSPDTESASESTEPVSEPEEPSDPVPETDFWGRNGQKQLTGSWSFPDYCTPVEEGSPLYDTGIRLQEGSEIVQIAGHYLHLFNYESRLYRLLDLTTGSQLRTSEFDQSFFYLPVQDGTLYVVESPGLTVRAVRPDGTETVLREPDAFEATDNQERYAVLTDDGRFLLWFDNTAKTIVMETLETGETVSIPSEVGISYIHSCDGESLCLTLWSGSQMRLYRTGDYLLSEPPRSNEWSEHSAGMRYYSRRCGEDTLLLFCGFPGNDEYASVVLPESVSSCQTLGCGILAIETVRDDTPFLFADLRSGVCLQPCEIPNLRCLSDLAVSEEGFALVSANVGGSEIALFLYDLAGAAPFMDIAVEEMSGEELKAGSEEILKALYEESGIEVLYGSEGNDFLLGDYVGEALLDPDIAHLNIRALSRMLERFPAGMLREAWEGLNGYEGIRLYLCGTLYGVSEYGIDRAGAVASSESSYLVIAFDSTSTDWTADIPHEFSHLFDRRIKQNAEETGVDWIQLFEKLSPHGYAESYVNYEKLMKYTYGGSSDPSQAWYIDCYCRTFSTEDRARLLEYLFREEETGMDRSLEPEHILYKAKAYCFILRKCFASLNGRDVYWERHLDMDGFTL